MTAGQRVELAFSHRGDHPSAVQRYLIDLISPDQGPYWVQLDGQPVPHLLDRRSFDAAEFGWHYSHSLRSVLVKYPNPRADHRLLVSFEPFDMIGI